MKKNKMLKLLLTALLAMGSGLSHANASDLYAFDINCTLTDTDSSSTYNQCAAMARVYAYVADFAELSESESAQAVNNLFAVSCDGELLYANGAAFSIGHQAVAISGPNNDPKLIVKRGSGSNPYTSAIRIADEHLHGTCTVASHPSGQ